MRDGSVYATGCFCRRDPVIPFTTPVTDCMPVLFTGPVMSLFSFPFSPWLDRDEMNPSDMVARPVLGKSVAGASVVYIEHYLG